MPLLGDLGHCSANEAVFSLLSEDIAEGYGVSVATFHVYTYAKWLKVLYGEFKAPVPITDKLYLEAGLVKIGAIMHF